MNNQRKVATPRVILQLLVFLIIAPMLPILISWRWVWWQAWAYMGVNLLGFLASRALAARRHPDILAERARSLQHADTKPWDKILSPLVGLGGALLPLVAGLDARLGWTRQGFSLTAEIIALVFIVAGFAFGSWALVENRFFSGVVRIQTDRGQTVVDSGPYRFLRHPGYAGALLTYISTPILLNSLWTYLPAAFLAIVLCIRTSLEDRTLLEELPGYKEYAKLTRFRLLPGIW